MKLFKKTLFITAGFVFASSLILPSAASAATSPTLGAAQSYSVIGHTTVSNTGSTTVYGDIGVSIGGAPVGFPPGIVGPPGTIRNAGDSLAAQNDNTAAFGFIDQTCDTTYAGTRDLVGSSLVAGVYCADAFTLTGTLNLTGTGVWIFKSASTLITSGTANVVGGDPCNVWWRQVSSATLGTNTSLIGNVLSSTAVIMQTGASLNGRAFAQTAAVTLDSNNITGQACIGAGGSTPSTPTTATPDASGNSSTSSTVTPKLPNAGIAPEDNSKQAIIFTLLSTVGLAFLIAYIVRRKKLYF